MSKIKICGLRREEDIRFANEVRPDFVGFVFAPSKRQVTAEEAGRLRKLLHPDIPAVGVFVNASPGEISDLASRGIIQMVQLHGQEDEAFIRQIGQLVHLPVIKAVSVTSREDILNSQSLPVDYLLFDQGKGGSGKTFDWSVLEEEHLEKPFFLAGGISADNVTEAIRRFHPYAVDASSSVETDGVKDLEKMRQLTQLVQKL